MTKVYVMETCPDCFGVKQKLQGNPDYQIIDIGEHVRNLKEFLRLRDNSPAFGESKAAGSIGIPCFVKENGEISFSADAFTGIGPAHGATCSLDGKGC